MYVTSMLGQGPTSFEAEAALKFTLRDQIALSWGKSLEDYVIGYNLLQLSLYQPIDAVVYIECLGII